MRHRSQANAVVPPPRQPQAHRRSQPPGLCCHIPSTRKLSSCHTPSTRKLHGTRCAWLLERSAVSPSSRPMSWCPRLDSHRLIGGLSHLGCAVKGPAKQDHRCCCSLLPPPPQPQGGQVPSASLQRTSNRAMGVAFNRVPRPSVRGPPPPSWQPQGGSWPRPP